MGEFTELMAKVEKDQKGGVIKFISLAHAY